MDTIRHALLISMIRQTLLEVGRLSVTEAKLTAKIEITGLLNHAKTALEGERKPGGSIRRVDAAWQFVRVCKLIADEVYLTVDGLNALDSSPQLFGK